MTPNDVTRNYVPDVAARLLVCIFVLPATLMFSWAGMKILNNGTWEGLLFIGAAALLTLWVVKIATIRVTLNDHELVRTWLLGTLTIPVAEISKLMWGGGRGQLLLTVIAEKKSATLSSISLKESELREIESSILAARGLAGYPRLPLYLKSMVDIKEMTQKYLGINGV